jgi:hypothetical protein
MKTRREMRFAFWRRGMRRSLGRSAPQSKIAEQHGMRVRRREYDFVAHLSL